MRPAYRLLIFCSPVVAMLTIICVCSLPETPFVFLVRLICILTAACAGWFNAAQFDQLRRR